MRIKMNLLVQDRVAAGSRTGRIVLSELVAKLNGQRSVPEMVYIDFEGIDVATASFLRECVLEFKQFVRRRWTHYYPVVANANECIREEMEVLVHTTNDVVVFCELDQSEQPRAMRLVGTLEPKQQETFDVVVEFGEIGASALSSLQTNTRQISHTAWNNRLASLSKLGLLIEIAQNRSKQYRPLPIEVQNGR